MFVVTTTFIRSSDQTPYYIDSVPSLHSQFDAFLNTNASLITSLVTENISTTTQVSTATYSDEVTYQTFMTLFNQSFPTFFSDRSAYCAANNIEIIRVEETV